MRKDYYKVFSSGDRQVIKPFEYKKNYSFLGNNYKVINDDHYALTDAQGLDRAYSLDNGIHIHGDTAFVAGTKSLGDAYDDLKIPFHMTSRAQRYQDLEKTLKNNPQVKNLVGHSLGGATVLEYQKNNPNLNLRTITYGSPSFSLSSNGNEERYRNFGDPISFVDFGARTNTLKSINPFTLHSYQNFNNRTENEINDNSK